MTDIPDRILKSGVREFQCIFCQLWQIDDGGNVDIMQKNKAVVCWPCWEDRPSQYYKWYFRRYFGQRKYDKFVYKGLKDWFHDLLFKICKRFDRGLYKYK